MGMPGPQKINRYGLEFKLRAVRMSEQPGVLVKDVAESLCIHPFMLSRWRKQAREGLIMTRGVKLDQASTAELKRLRELEKKYKLLQQEHELLKKAIRFASDQKRKSSSSSKQTGPRTKSR